MRVKQQRKKHQLSSWLLLGIKRHWLLDFFVHLTHQEVTDTFISQDWPSRQKDLKSIYLLLLSRVKGLPSIGEIPLNFQAVHMCYWASPTPSHASTSTGRPSSVWICVFLLDGQELLPTLSRCSVRSSASEEVFLTHPWREECSPSTCSPTILSSSRIAIVKFLMLSTRKIFVTIPE